MVRAVLAAPDDDLVRLAYADWLDENGHGERAKNLRWFMANPQYHQSIPIGHAMPWMPQEDKDHLRYSGLHCGVFHRGFVSEVRTDAARLLAHGPRLLYAEPVVRVTVVGAAPCRVNRSGYGWYNGAVAASLDEDEFSLPEWLFDAVIAVGAGEGGTPGGRDRRGRWRWVAFPFQMAARKARDAAALCRMGWGADKLADEAGEGPIYGERFL